MDTTKLSMTISGPRLHQPVKHEPGQTLVYGTGSLLQVSPTEVALLSNLRIAGIPVVDLENGGDVVVADDLRKIRVQDANPVIRNCDAVHPQTGEPLLMVQHLAGGGFVPLGAKLADGRPHPAAGTGFGLGVAISYPADLSSPNPPEGKGAFHFNTLVQFRYSGDRFEITKNESLSDDQVVDGWRVFNRGLGSAVPDGEDLLFGIVAGRVNEVAKAHRKRIENSSRKEHPHANAIVGECYGSGLGRWRYGPEGWRPVSYTPVTGPGPDMSFEPSIVRDLDGSLLFCVRGKGCDASPGEESEGLENTYEHFRVYRSADAGRTWQSTIHLPLMRAPSPVVLNRALDGMPYLAANPFCELMTDNLGRTIMKGKVRNRLCLWALTPDRMGVEGPVCALDADREFGPARPIKEERSKNIWYLDHPQGGVFSLGDGKLHGLLVFRVTDAAVTSNGALPAARAGTWVEEIFSGGDPKPVWRF